MSWQLLTALSVLSLSTSVLLQRVLLHKDKVDPYGYAVTFQFIVGALLLVFAIPHGLKLPGIGAVIVPAVISIIAFGVGHILYAKTLQLVEASAFSTLFATQAIWIMLLGILLFKESLTAVQVVGSVLIFSSVGMLVKSWKNFKLDKGTFLGLLTGLVFGVAITSWSYVGRHTDGLSWAALSFIGTAAAALLVKPSTYRKIPSLLGSRVLPKMLLLGVLYGLGSLAMLYAYRKGTFSVVTPLRQTSIMVTTLLALVFLANERTRILVKLAAAAISFVGACLLVL
ncbi:EamA family transporter [Candidatus Saccharibacteria bacterium]|nr:MAG: EamA family transporter [Candidatus Saccharibacteria bacterium]